MSFIDDYSKFTWIFVLKKKSDVFQKFPHFQHHVERLFDKKILALQTIGEASIRSLIPFSSV
jgi:hypothetical protein